jgi:hypothetical protein
MNGLFHNDVADKARRGLRGRVGNGELTRGFWYGYHGVTSPVGSNVTTGQRQEMIASAARERSERATGTERVGEAASE